MKPIRSTHTPPRKVARLIAGAKLVLAWIGMMLFTDAAPQPKRRYLRTRYWWLASLDRIARTIGHLILARAVQLSRRRPKHRTTPLDYVGAGFARRIRRGAMLRALLGSALRKALKHPDQATRFARLVHTLNNIDAYARRLLHRLRRGATRLYAIIAVRPPHARVLSLVGPCTPALVDSS